MNDLQRAPLLNRRQFKDLLAPLHWVPVMLLFVGASAGAQDDDARSKVDGALQQEINRAIGRGVDSLMRQQEIDGSWKNAASGYPNGQTSLSLYTLLKCDVKPERSAIGRAVEYLRMRKPTKTYSAGLQLMALCALNDSDHKDWIREISEDLQSWQRGGYGYPGGAQDLSNTQYAALGLRAAANSGHKVFPKTWERLAEWTLKHQQRGSGGGFQYRQNHMFATGSMTSAGVAVLAICQEQLTRPGRQIKPALERGQRWLNEHFRADANPRREFVGNADPGGNAGRPYYYIYGLERVGALLSTSHFGEHDWYLEGATWLLGKQKPEGSWGNQAETCFALLFLSRATAKQTFTGPGISSSARTYGSDSTYDDVSLRAAGRGPIKVWVSSFGKHATDDFGWKRKGSKELRVDHVEYWLEDAHAKEGSTLLTTVRGDPGRSAHGQRFAAKLDIKRTGTFGLFARVYLRLPPEQAKDYVSDEDGTPEGMYKIESRVLKVDVFQADDDLLDLYAADARNNLLRNGRNKISSSTDRNGDQAAKAAFDGRVGTQWVSASDDPKPSIHIELARAVRGDLLLFTLACDDVGGIVPPNRTAQNRPAAIRKLRVTVNGSKKSFEVEVDPDPRRKVELSLGHMTKITRIDIEVLEVTPGGRADQGVGFSEIEFVHERKRVKR